MILFALIKLHQHYDILTPTFFKTNWQKYTQLTAISAVGDFLPILPLLATSFNRYLILILNRIGVEKS